MSVIMSERGDRSFEAARRGTTEIPLSGLVTGECGTVSRLEGGEEFYSKMLALGISPGKSVAVIRGSRKQPYLVRVDDSRVMVDWLTLNNIYIQTNRGGSERRRKWGWGWKG